MIIDAVHVETGEKAEFFYKAADMPGLDEVFEIEGQKYKRVVSVPAMKIHNPVVCTSASKWHPDAPRHDDRGFAVFNSQKEQREFCKNAKTASGDSYIYDD